MESSKLIFPSYKYDNYVQVRGGVYVYQAVLSAWGVRHRGSILVIGVRRIAKSDRTNRRLELFPQPSRLELWLPVSFRTDVRVGMTGIKYEARRLRRLGSAKRRSSSLGLLEVLRDLRTTMGAVWPDGSCDVFCMTLVQYRSMTLSL